jgi:signal transduction histidine kinase
VSIRDEGQGIAEDFKPKIFQKFAQADTGTTRSYQGTGLGLNICKKIIEGHLGTIDFITQIGKGTTFFFDLHILEER